MNRNNSTKGTDSDESSTQQTLPINDLENLDYYQILEVDPKANDHDIRQAYIKQSLKWHPDRYDFQGTKVTKEYALQRFQAIAQAYDTLW